MRRISWLAATAVLLAGISLLPAGAAADIAIPPAPPEARELRFAPGRSTISVSDAAIRGEHHIWRFTARAGQSARLGVTAQENNAVFQLWRPGARLPAEPGGSIQGKTLPGAGEAEDARRWRGRLPESGTYLVVVGPTRGNASYTLTLTIQP